MAMGEHDGIHAAEVVAQRLRAQIGPGIDQHTGTVVRFDEDGRPQPLVLWVV